MSCDPLFVFHHTFIMKSIFSPHRINMTGLYAKSVTRYALFDIFIGVFIKDKTNINL